MMPNYSDDLTDAARYPGLTEHGARVLRFLREHPSAPRYTATCGHHLTPEWLAQVRVFDASLDAEPDGWTPGGVPAWMDAFVEQCFSDVPFYRQYGARPQQFGDIPACTREDISHAPWSFVPDSQPLDGLVWYNTTGTTGHPLIVMSHPVTAASYLPLVRRALSAHGVTLSVESERVLYLLVGWQRKSYAYPSVVPEMAEMGCAKLNLHPADWRDPDDRARFLDVCDPQFYTGDPLAFAELMRLPLRTSPRALVSTAMALLPGMRGALEAHFACPVIDLYSMNETGPIAFTQGDARILLQPRLFVEVLDERGAPCPPGVRGELVVSGGMNPFLPLLRYRTSDFASLEFRGRRPVIVGLEGRQPVIYRSTGGTLLNNLDVTNPLRPLALPQFTLHQRADGALAMRVRAPAPDEAAIRTAVRDLFGADQAVSIEIVDSLGDKVVQYTSDITM
ncbi:MAG: capsule biosynthesis protein CapK [Chloroflexi bacterium]|nr:capsule biosynthesis protein CapK [Chloroflexota bacterium]